MRTLSGPSGVPEYHAGMLFVQVRPVTFTVPTAAGPLGGVARGTASVEAFGAAPPSVGFAALSYYERAGLIRRVVPMGSSLGPQNDRDPSAFAFSALTGVGATAAMVAGAVLPSERESDRIAGGLSLIELEREEDRERVQIAMASDPNVVSVSRIPVRYLAARQVRRADPGIDDAPPAGMAAVPPAPASMWNLRKIRWDEARALFGFRDADGIDVDVLDTGVDLGHPDLQGRIVDYLHTYPDVPVASSDLDLIGHGTHVSGTIGALINNGLGINGICACRLTVRKIFDDVPTLVRSAAGWSYEYFVDPALYVRALLDCVDARPAVINLSIGGSGRPSTPETLAFQQLIANGTAIVAAMGNERQSSSPISYPAAIPGVIAVGATGLADRVSRFSSRGNHIALCAPGESIWSTLPTYPGQNGFEAVIGPDGQPHQGRPRPRDTDYAAWNGTSMATPHVTAAVALYLANGGDPTLAAIRAALTRTADKVAGMPPTGFNADYGNGRLNLLALLQRAGQGVHGAPRPVA